MKTKLCLAVTLAIVSALLACDPKEDLSPDGSEQPSVGTITGVGNPDGNAISQTIGPEGGRLATPDGVVQLVLPAGAVTQPTTITIQPITNHTPNGIGKAYRFSPDGLQFDKPATLTFQYTDDQVTVNEAEGLKVAFQGEDKAWYNVAGVQVDTQQKRISVPMAHFSDWSAYETTYLESFVLNSVGKPQTDFLQYGDRLNLLIVDLSFSLDDAIIKMADANYGEVKDVKWSLVGAGKLEKTATKKGIVYVAPASGTERIQVTVNAEITFQKTNKKLIIIQSIYVGNNYLEITFDGQTRVYNDVSIEFANGQCELNAGSREDDYFTMAILGQAAGTYPFGNVLKSESGISSGYYNQGKYAYRTYYSCLGDHDKGIQITEGSIVIEELRRNQLIKGSFSGSLMKDDNEKDCPDEQVPIKGTFYIAN